MTRIRQLVGTRKGMGSWVGQSLTALVMLAALVYLLVAYAVASPSGHAELAAMVGANYFRVPATLGAAALVWHAWLGAKSILMDYVKWPWLRIAKYVGVICYLALCMIWFLGVTWSL